jgi:hypothetical protein
MAKRDLLKEVKNAGLLSEEANVEDLTEADLERLLGRAPVWEGSLSASKPLVAPDGHETLTKEDIEARG